MSWKTQYTIEKPKLKKPILIEGLPGIGNCGKVAIDFIIQELKAKKLAEFRGDSLPHSVFVNEKNLIEMPTIELYYKKNGTRDFLLLAGDVQPSTEESCYSFCDEVLSIAQEFDCQEIITLGGVALRQEPKNPQVYITGNNKRVVEKYAKGSKTNTKLYGKVGPIIGVSGLLLGLAQRKNIPAVSLLAETLGHPMYLGISGAREILRVLKKKLDVNVDVSLLDREIQEIEEEINRRTVKKKKPGDVNYIG
ncbi:MAG: PAC2 family protein [Candidatus Woesearchaeota archaeon]